MSIYKELYDFAASAGSFEGYVYPKDLNFDYLPRWSGNLVRQYNALPEDVREQFQELCDATLGRAVQALLPAMGDDHEVIKNLRSMIKGEIPASPDDFEQDKERHNVDT